MLNIGIYLNCEKTIAVCGGACACVLQGNTHEFHRHVVFILNGSAKYTLLCNSGGHKYPQNQGEKKEEFFMKTGHDIIYMFNLGHKNTKRWHAPSQKYSLNQTLFFHFNYMGLVFFQDI